MANIDSQKLSCCSLIICPGTAHQADQNCFVCGAAVHASRFAEVSFGHNFTPGNFYCSMQCIHYDNDNNIDNDAVKAKRESLMAHNKSQLRTLARGVGAKISYCPPGQGSKDLSKEGIVCHIMEKEFISQLVTGQASVPGTASGADSAPAEVVTLASPSIVTINNNFCLVNVMFCKEVMEISSQCGSTATQSELDTNMVGTNSPFWNKVASSFHSADGCDPFEHTYYSQHHSY
jgi:hypothetical protein